MLKAFSFFLIPLYTSFLTTEEYGIVNLATGFFAVASSLLTLSLSYALVRFYADYRDDQKMVAKMIGTVMTFTLLVSVAFIVLFTVGGDLVSMLFFSGQPFWPVVFLSIIISVVSALYTMYQEILKGMQDATKSVVLSYVYFFMLLAGNILTVVKLDMGAEGVLISTFITNMVMVVIMFIDLWHRKLMILGIDGAILKKFLRYSVPLIPHTMAYNVSNYATKIIIADKLSLSMLGIYSLASQFGNIADVVLNSVQSAFQPWMFGVLKQETKEGRAQLTKNTYILMWLYGLVFLGLASFSQEVVLLIADESYAEAWTYIPAVVISIALKSPLYFYNSYMYYDVTKTKYVFVSTLVGSVVNICMTWLLVPYFQIYGSIAADIIAMLARMVIVIRVLPKDVKSIYSLRKFAIYSVIPVLFIAVGLIPSYTVYREELSVVNFGYKVFVILAYVAVVLLANRNNIQPMLNNYKQRRQK